MMFNINKKVKVRLTDRGSELLKGNHKKFWSVFGKNAPEYIKPTEDENGWSEWQLWCLMEQFGEHLHIGILPPFETEIEIINHE